MLGVLRLAARELFGFFAPTVVTTVTNAPVPGLDFEFVAHCDTCEERDRYDDFHLHTSRYGKTPCMCHGCGSWNAFNFNYEQLRDLQRSSYSHWQRFKPTPYSWPRWSEEEKQAWLNTSFIGR